MKILFLSDIHGITTNLEKIKNIIESHSFDKIILLGDVFDYRFSSESRKIDTFFSHYLEKLIVLKGNCDSPENIEKSSLTFIDDITFLTVDGMDIYVTHGNRYHKDNNPFFTNGVMVYGHEHIPYIVKEKDMTYINTGSLSIPRNEKGATYTIYENRCFTIYSIEDNRVIDSITL